MIQAITDWTDTGHETCIWVMFCDYPSLPTLQSLFPQDERLYLLDWLDIPQQDTKDANAIRRTQRAPTSCIQCKCARCHALYRGHP